MLVPRRFLVIINPVAGAKKSERLFKQYVQPKLDLADIQYIIEVTSELPLYYYVFYTHDL